MIKGLQKLVFIYITSIIMISCATTKTDNTKQDIKADPSQVKLVASKAPETFTIAGGEELYLCLGETTINCFKIPRGNSYESLPLKMKNQWIENYKGRLLADDILEAQWPSGIIAKIKLVDNGNAIIYGFDSQKATQGTITWYRGL